MNRKHILGFAVSVLSLISASGRLAGQEIRVDAAKVLGRVSRLLTGACIEDVNHEIYGGIYSQMIFGESFQEPPPAPTIIGFTRYAGAWSVNDGVLSIQGTDGPKLVSDGPTFKDGTLGVSLKFDDRKAGNGGLIVRVDKPQSGADRFIGYEVSLDPARQRLILARHRNNFEPIKDVACDVPVGQWISLEVKLAGPVLDITVDGKQVLRHDDGEKALPEGGIGLRAWQREVSYRSMWYKTGELAKALPFNQKAQIPGVSGMWRAVHTGTAQGSFALKSERPFAGTQSQQVTFGSGEGEWGIDNQGLNRWGMNFVAGRPYEGYVWARADKPTTLVAALESRHGTRRYASFKLSVTSTDWQRLDFTLTPSAADDRGQFTLALTQPGSVVLGHAFLQPGEWGRFKGLPVRRDVAEAMIDQGITVLRYGGSMVNNPEYRWKKMIGSRDRRPPYTGYWYRHSTNGWGIVDFMNFCEAAGFEYVPDFSFDETPQDLADFIEYAKGSADSEWGRKRVADGHPAPYRLRYMELGNEECVDEKYAVRFETMARAIWAKDRDLILVVGDFQYDHPIRDSMNVTGAASKITSLAGHAKILELARKHDREVWFDVHLWTEGPGASPSLKALPTFIDALGKLSEGAKHKVVVFEYNANNHGMRRALGNALATNMIERDGRLPIVTSANGLQPDKHNDNGWDQGLLFLNPGRVWLQPPGSVTQMLSRNYLPQVVHCGVTDAKGQPSEQLDVTAKRSEDGKTLVLQVVNRTDQAITAAILLNRFRPKSAIAQVTELSGELNAANTADQPREIVPRQSEWKHELQEGKTSRTFPARSFTILRWEGQAMN